MLVGALAGLICVLALPPAGAAAASRVGNECTADKGTTLGGIVQLGQSAGPIPMVAPASGVITAWSATVGAALPDAPHRIHVLRAAGPTSFVLLASSPQVSLRPGPNSFPVRLPIAAGDRIGLEGTEQSSTYFCATPSSFDRIGVLSFGLMPGAPQPLGLTDDQVAVPVVAVIEPDADGDGYGDETQDRCPGSAAHQDCPAAIVDATADAGRATVTVSVTTDRPATVRVSGNVRLGKGAKAKLAARAKTVAPGKLTRFTLKFPRKLKSKLKELESGRRLTLKITASATNATGQV
ncbi:MAG TPA: hypothetical protein VFB52_04905, partial [Solirubrobacterales bacterium]|nr:hypothetical protein [Solirubrobacterales bacterium]